MDDEQLIRVLKALGDPRRFRMVQEIAAAGEISCGELGDKFSLSQPTVSHHLKILSDAGVLRVRADAKHHFISVDRDLLDRIADVLPSRLGPLPRPKRRPR